MPKFYAHLAPAAPAKSAEYMTKLFDQLRAGIAGCAEFNKYDLSLVKSWLMQGWTDNTDVVIDEAQHVSERPYTHMFYENDLLDIIARSECLAGTQGVTTPILACFDEDAGVPIIDEDGKPDIVYPDGMRASWHDAMAKMWDSLAEEVWDAN